MQLPPSTAAAVDPDASASSSETNATVVGTSAAPAEDHATRGRGGRYSRGGGRGRCAEAAAAAEAVPRPVTRPTLYTTLLAEQGKMNWAEACYLSQQLHHANMSKSKAMSANAFAVAQDPMDAVSADDARRLRCRSRSAAAVPASHLQTNTPPNHIPKHTPDSLAKRRRGPLQQCMEPLEPSQMIVGNKVSVQYDHGEWYKGMIASIAQTKRGKVLDIAFDDGDVLSHSTWKPKDTKGFRHDVERDNPITLRWGVVYRLLGACGEAQWSQRCQIAECELPDALENLKTKIMTGAYAPVDLDKLEAFLIQKAGV
jgi:hypothetical protein